MKVINRQLLDATTEKAKQSPRRRMNHNFHEDLNDPVNRLLNAMEPDTYIRPHRHLQPDKDEYFLVLRGKAVVFIFDEKGYITEQVLLDPLQGTYGAEIKAGIWHGLLVLESGTVLYEIKPGPFAPLSEENLAAWSPDPEEKEAVNTYLEHLRYAYPNTHM
ncbi:MAG: WbuC family cupin fold metalloprotein [Tannerellaceae bacterium]|nr:WbuC family cupin fold metalloprotein [Tannerellaceae bacterium]